MADVLQGTLDPRVAPRRVLLRHTYDKAANLRQHATTFAALRRIRPFVRDQLPMPPKNRVGSNDRGDSARGTPTRVDVHERPADAGRRRSAGDVSPAAPGGEG